MQIVNKRTHQPTDKDLYIGRPSRFGNPFVIPKDGDRAEVVEKYRHWLWEQIKSDPNTKQELLALEQYDNLVCFCAPQACHGDVIIRAIAYLKSQD